MDEESSIAWEKEGFLHRFAAMIIADPIITILLGQQVSWQYLQVKHGRDCLGK